MVNEQEEEPIFEEEQPEESPPLTHVDFDLMDTTGRWFLKVIAGPNMGAEFSMQGGSSYLIGTDTNSCDIVFQDLSVSRQHARIAIDAQERVTIEDLNSRNGTFVDGERLTGRKAIVSNSLVTMGTTTFMLIDREGERQTIVSPLLAPQMERIPEKPEPGAAGAGEGPPLAKETLGGIQEAILPPAQSEVEKIKEAERKEARLSHAISGLVVLVAITGLFVVIGVGTTMLFKTEEVPQEHVANADTLIAHALKEYPTVRYSFNPANGKLLLVGHVLTTVDRSRILDNLQELKFVSQIDYSNIVIDEDVWRETNQVLARNPAWQSVTVSSPIPGKFVLNGFLKTRKQADELYDYMSHNFAYPNLLERHVIVEEELKAKIAQQLDDAGFRTVQIAIDNGAITLTGTISHGTLPEFTKLVSTLKTIPGIKSVQSFVAEVAPEQTLINLTSQYHVNGYSVVGNNIYVVIDNRILRKGDVLDGRRITNITNQSVFLEKDGVKYRIDFNQ